MTEPKKPVQQPQNANPQPAPGSGNAAPQANTPPTTPTEQPQTPSTAVTADSLGALRVRINEQIRETQEFKKLDADQKLLENFERKIKAEKEKLEVLARGNDQEKIDLSEKIIFRLQKAANNTRVDINEGKVKVEKKQNEIFQAATANVPLTEEQKNYLGFRSTGGNVPINPPVVPGTPPTPPNNQPVVSNAAPNSLDETPEQKKAREDREEALKEQLTGDDAANKLRLGYQAALMIMADKLLNDSARVSFGNIDRRKKSYNNFAVMRTQQVGHLELTNALFKTTETSLFFDKIPPVILSSLVPSIKLYYVLFPELMGEYKTSNSNIGRSYSWRIPFDDLPVDYKDKNENSLFVSDTIDKILKGEGKMNGCGIKSFQYAYKGTNPSETNTHVEASLELFFQDIALLTKTIPITEKDTRFIDGEPSGLKDRSFAYSDLINGASRYIRNGGKLLANDQYFRIKAEIGYAEPSEIFYQNLLKNNFKPEDARAYIKAIKNAKIIFYLSPVTHDIGFNEDGTVTLKINYQATIDSILSDYNLNIFSITSKDPEIVNAQKEIDDLYAERQTKITNIKCQNLSPPIYKETLKKVNDDIYKRAGDLKTKLDNLKNLAQEELFRKLIGIDEMVGNIGYPDAYKVGIHNSAVGVDKEGKPITGALQFRLQAGAKIREAGLKNHESISVRQLPNGSATANTNAPEQKKEKKESGFITAVKSIGSVLGFSSTPQQSNSVPGSREQAELEKDNSEYVTIKYVYLGDIIDIAAECLQTIRAKGERPKIILGEIPINIPTNISAEENDLLVPVDADVEEVILNIADIPISMDAFDDFFYQKVIKPKRANYPLLKFINDIIEFLLKPAINPSVFGKKAAINNKIRMSHLGFSLPCNSINQEPILNRFNDASYSGAIDKEKLASFSRKSNLAKPVSQEITNSALANYLFIFDSLSAPQIIQINNGDFDKDVSSGIYHFQIGKDAGLIKSISFSKTDVPLAAEARALQEGGKVTNRLRQMYSSEIKLFGNNIFRPGDYIYIDPVIFGNNAQYDIGIGGYYMVIRVNTSVDPSSYETVLSCHHQAWVVGGKTRLPNSNTNNC